MSSEQPTHRREFITGRTAGKLVQGAAGRAADHFTQFADALSLGSPAPTEPVTPGYVLSLSRKAMACEFEIRLNADRRGDDRQTGAAMEALDLVEELEDQMTVYREVGEMVELNQQASHDWVEVEPRLFAMFELADTLYQQTGGAFDITGGPLSRAWGFDVRRGRIPTEEQLTAARSVVGWQYVELDRDRHRVRFNKPGVELNVNSIGKGYAVDRAAEVLAEQGVENFLFHGGRSTLLARGQRTGCEGWTARVRHPLRPQQVVAEFTLLNQALSTSGAATQSFVIGGQRYGHLIDPRTGQPADTMHSVTVVADNGALADALSTAFFVMGEQAAVDYCEQHPEVQALLVLAGNTPGEVRLRPLNLVERER
ncbi:FAD:protein FMN transferase [Aeoliella mucimassa]|uniref:FAD:protein FMN transferase n=1 Tax=Aeoliella mucimassa TaxID=2527972 RepID=A0A518AT47_9BACT|nr:FAD:protein FMN transferase [Aeoliella mucimassa]QDU57891.1 Thiamine biosynthesis lipoprotein ApbE precursor [Aeoliella mucimassa]